MQVLVTFSGKITLDQFEEHLKVIKGLGAKLELGGVPLTSKKKSGKGDPFTTVTESLTAAEKELIDQGLQLTHENGEAPLMEALTIHGVGTLKPNMTQEIIDYFTANPGYGKAQCAGFLADKYVAHYESVNDAFVRIGRLINVMCLAKGNQRALEARGAHRAWHKPIFVLQQPE